MEHLTARFCLDGVGGDVYPLGTKIIYTKCCGNLEYSCEDILQLIRVLDGPAPRPIQY